VVVSAPSERKDHSPDHPEARAVLRRHVLGHAAERLGADRILIADLLQRLEEPDQVDHTLAGHVALVVAHLLGRLRLRVGDVDVDDAALVGGEDVGGGAAGVMPMPCIQGCADIGTDLLGERYGLGQRPDERLLGTGAEHHGSKKLQPEPDARLLQDRGDRREPREDELPPLVAGLVARRREHGHHPGAANLRSELRVFLELRESGLVSGVIRGGELDGQVGDARLDPRLLEEGFGRLDPVLTSGGELYVHARVADLARKAHEVGPCHLACERPVEREEHGGLGRSPSH
jgi:hypothetical protein